ncbi:hypothetical protein GHNINEIG_00094 [Hydrogenovibrio crunogenus]|uniref:Uncharacterized protein n=1 Tax=Hydrogenovibrio crunogenus TaxID=39765 RepID=A0A4P7NWK0_9GAMM|nr:hypothetical protein [Hydrogenovibrio crunogenus]QBZ82070.1 hypothetical protein GHNINEIG_00094 [Hydrogenovibrio crunogenus]
MHLIENEFEQKLLHELPPHARDIGLDLVSTRSLGELLVMLDENQVDKELLSVKKVPASLWEPILRAALLAKTTYFLPNSELSQEEILFLIKAACMSSGYPLPEHSLAEIIELTEEDMPVFHRWLLQLTKNLQEKRA